MDDSQAAFAVIRAAIIGKVIMVAVNLGTEASCRSDAIAAGMKGAEVKEACK